MINGNTELSQENAIDYLNGIFTTIGYELKAVADENGIVIKDSTETNSYMALYNANAPSTSRCGYTLYYNNGNSNVYEQSGGSSSVATTYEIYYCNNGVLIHGSKGSTAVHGRWFISKNDDRYVFGAMVLSTLSMAIATYEGLSYKTIDQVFNEHSNTIMNNLPVYGGINDICYAQYVYTIQQRQYSDSGKLTLNGDEYISNGYWAIKD